MALRVHVIDVKANNWHFVLLKIELFESALEGEQVLECVLFEPGVGTSEGGFDGLGRNFSQALGEVVCQDNQLGWVASIGVEGFVVFDAQVESRSLLRVDPAVEEWLFTIGDEVINLFDEIFRILVDGVQVGARDLHTVASDVVLHIGNVITEMHGHPQNGFV